MSPCRDMKKTESYPASASKPKVNEVHFHAMPVGIAVSTNRIFARVNPHLCEMMGYSPEELIGQSVRVLFATDEEFERVGCDAYADLRAHGSGVIETVFLHKNGKLLNVLLSSTQISADNNSTEVTSNIIDITQSRQ